MVAGNYDFENEALVPLDAEIVEIDGANRKTNSSPHAHDADAVYAKGRNFTKRMIDGLEKAKIIALGTVGSDYIDVAAATAKGIPVTNVPDTFIEEVADHAMMLLLSAFRRVLTQDRMVRDGRWREGRPGLNQPRLMGLTLGFIAFGHVARATAMRAKPFGLRLMAYDPYIEELVMSPYGVQPATLEEVLTQSDFVSMHAPATGDGVSHADGAALQDDEAGRDLHQHRARPDRRRGGTDQGACSKAGSPAPVSTCSRSSRPSRTIRSSRWTMSC